MPLPTPDQLRELHRILNRERLSGSGKTQHYGSRAKKGNTIKSALGQGLTIAATQQAQQAVTQLSGTGTPLVLEVGGQSVAFFPIGAALGPWISAAQIARKADGVFALHDLREFATGAKGSYYPCSCGQCAEGLQYIIDKKETKIAISAISPFTAGLPSVISVLNSTRKHFQSNRPKEQYSRKFVASAQGGCLNATATIMLLCGGKRSLKPPFPKYTDYMSAVTCIIADNGWELLKSKW